MNRIKEYCLTCKKETVYTCIGHFRDKRSLIYVCNQCDRTITKSELEEFGDNYPTDVIENGRER